MKEGGGGGGGDSSSGYVACGARNGCPKRTLYRGARRMGRRQQRGKMGDGGVAGYVAPLTHTPPTPLVGMVATSKREKESRGRLVTRGGGLGEGRSSAHFWGTLPSTHEYKRSFGRWNEKRGKG